MFEEVKPTGLTHLLSCRCCRPRGGVPPGGGGPQLGPPRSQCAPLTRFRRLPAGSRAIPARFRDAGSRPPLLSDFCVFFQFWGRGGPAPGVDGRGGGSNGDLTSHSALGPPLLSPPRAQPDPGRLGRNRISNKLGCQPHAREGGGAKGLGPAPVQRARRGARGAPPELVGLSSHPMPGRVPPRRAGGGGGPRPQPRRQRQRRPGAGSGRASCCRAWGTPRATTSSSGSCWKRAAIRRRSWTSR